MHAIFCPWIQYMNLLQFFFKEELALKVYVWERKIKDISVKTLTFARPLPTTRCLSSFIESFCIEGFFMSSWFEQKFKASIFNCVIYVEHVQLQKDSMLQMSFFYIFCCSYTNQIDSTWFAGTSKICWNCIFLADLDLRLKEEVRQFVLFSSAQKLYHP